MRIIHFATKLKRPGVPSTTKYRQEVPRIFNTSKTFRIHYIDGAARRVTNDLVEDVGKLDFVLFPRYVSDVGRANNVVHRQQVMVGVDQWFLFVDIDGSHAWPSSAQRIDKAPRSISGARLCLTSNAVGFMQDRSSLR